MRKRIAFRGPPYTWRYMLTRPWEIVSWVWGEVRWFIQRGLYGYSDYDWWGLDGYLLKWLPSALRELANGHGYPADLTEVEWRDMLLKTADGLDKGRDYLDNPWDYHEDYDAVPAEFGEAMDFIHKWFWHLWD